MRHTENSRISALELCGLLEHLLESAKLSPEVEYRIRKLITRTTPITDKMFLKTVKGKELIVECLELARLLENQLVSGRQGVYGRLTQLENAHDELLKRTYEFRVKAG